MQAISTSDALRLWETGHALRPAERAQALLAAACPEELPASLTDLPVGDRNARLLRARMGTFGAALPCESRCPACGEKLEFALSVHALLASADAAHAPITVAHEGQTYTFRLPTDGDLLAVMARGGDARDLLVRCLIEGDAAALPDAVIRKAETRMAEADPLALINLDLECPACGHTWADPLDVADFFFTELAESARRALVDVHRLARAYGWREADVLALSPWRRQQYLSLVGG